MVEEFYSTYRQVCSEVGVSLQEPRDAAEDKAFGPTTRGSMLGVWFDTVKWIWWVAEDKVIRYVHGLQNMLNMEVVTQREVWSVVGKNSLCCLSHPRIKVSHLRVVEDQLYFR